MNMDKETKEQLIKFYVMGRIHQKAMDVGIPNAIDDIEDDLNKFLKEKMNVLKTETIIHHCSKIEMDSDEQVDATIMSIFNHDEEIFGNIVQNEYWSYGIDHNESWKKNITNEDEKINSDYFYEPHETDDFEGYITDGDQMYLIDKLKSANKSSNPF